MISFMPLLRTLEEVGISRTKFIRQIARTSDYWLNIINGKKPKKFLVSKFLRLTRKLNCEVGDIIEFIDDDGHVLEVQGYALCDKDKYDLPHKWGPLLEQKMLFNFRDDELIPYLHICRTVWYCKLAAIRRGEWVAFKKETVEAFIQFSGRELHELCEDVHPRIKKPLKDTIIEKLEEIEHDKNKHSV